MRTAAGYLRATATSANTSAAATEATGAALAADRAANTAATDAATARAAANTAAADPPNRGDETAALGDAGTDLGDAARALGTAADVLDMADTKGHVPFQIRAEVKPGDEAYILVAAANAEPDLAVQFHGAIAASTVQRQDSLNAGDQHPYPITVTAPGLLTVETTGSTDTAGMLSAAVTAMDDNSGSGNNFRIVAPVGTGSYTVSVDGQTPSTQGAYTLDMDFKVAMSTTGMTRNEVMVAGALIWTDTTESETTAVLDDDTTLQIKRIVEDGNRADEDYFLLTIDR